MEIPDMLPASRHFQLEQLAEGVFVALAEAGRGAMSNAGIIDLGGQVLIFDTFWTPQAARDLWAAAEQLTGHPVTYVVNSHADGDHVHGNAVFAGSASIIATEGTRQAMAGRGREFIAWARENFGSYLKTREQYIASEPDEQRRAKLQVGLATQRELGEALPKLELALPDVTFEQRLTIHGSRRSVEVVELGGGHSESDSILLLPVEKVAFVGDLFGVRRHPVVQRGDPRAWVAMLEQIETLDLARLVPGHGPVGMREDVALMRQLLHDMLRLAGEAVEHGRPAAETAEMAVPARYADWGEVERFGNNMRFLHRFLSPQQPDPALLPRKE
ncbi:MAG: MBL fold metallo-hydrolase [Ktedonobacteraceae bacterium]|nr:MBL fold metallo-hydrolase [Ktedonobacteraceae bacterium]